MAHQQPTKDVPAFRLRIKRDHPGLPRLLRAAGRMPHAMFRRKGVEMRGTGLLVPEVVEEFFSALAAVVGDEMTDAIVAHLAGPLDKPGADTRLVENLLGGSGVGGAVLDIISRLDPAQNVQVMSAVGGMMSKVMNRRKK